MAIQDDQAFLKRLLATFKIETEEHLQAMSTLLLELEQASAQAMPPIIETLFREAHSLKGAARSVNSNEVECICQELESVLANLKHQAGIITLLPVFFDTVNNTLDALRHLVGANSQSGQPTNSVMVADIVNKLKNINDSSLDSSTTTTMTEPLTERLALPPRMEKSIHVPEGNTQDTVRISTAKLAALMVQAEELLAFKFSVAHRAAELKSLRSTVDLWKKEWTRMTHDARVLRRAAEKYNSPDSVKQGTGVDRLLDTIERDEFFIRTLSNRLLQIETTAEQDRRSLTGMVDTLLEDMKQTLMLPFSSLLEFFPKMVRDISRENGKEVELIISGAAIEIDRRVLEQIKSPVIHLLRNAIDHGIEIPQERVLKNKLRLGRVTLSVIPKEGNKIELIIADDGVGINPKSVMAAAVRLGMISAERAQDFNQQDALNFIFESGMSTSPILTDMSGRGLGLAIVREKVEKLGGAVAVELPDVGGTLFRVTLPTSLATFRGLVVVAGERQFILPSHQVDRVARIPKDVIKTIENRDTIQLNNQTLPLVNLAEVLELPKGKTTSLHQADYVLVAVLLHAGKSIAFHVNEVIGDQDVLVKNLGPQLHRVRNISSATVLGAGRVVPILNVADLFKSALKNHSSMVQRQEETTAQSASLLIAEDSITSRALLKNILESAGYQVTTAVDGMEALTLLRTGEFDLVISDVEMPRMDGFNLTAKIRADKKYSALPVILVTALGSREHKERGIDVGANAYIVKSSFDQGNLLDVIRRLL